MVTTIQVSEKLVKQLKTRKMYNKESYEEIIWDLLEDNMELSEQTKKHIENSKREIAAGKTVSLEKIKRDIGM